MSTQSRLERGIPEGDGAQHPAGNKNMESCRYDGKRVAISGAAGGLGRAMAQRFAEAGASLLLIDRDLQALTRLAAELPDVAGVLVCDQTRAADVERAEHEAGTVDVFVNNAGITVRGPLEDMSYADLQKLVDTNLVGAMAMAIAIARGMLARGRGVIVNVASQLALGPAPGRTVYGAAKAGIVQFTRSAAAEWARRGVRVAAIAPGPVDTPMVAALKASPEATRKLLDTMPIGRLLTSDEIAGIVLLLASPAAAAVVGQTWVADGGNLVA